MVTPCSSQWRKRKEAGEEEEREEREREKEKLPTENHCFRSSSLSLSLEFKPRVFISRVHPFYAPPLVLSRSLSTSQASFSTLFFFVYIYIYILDPEPSSRHSNESFRDFNPLLFHPRASTAHERTQIYTLQFRIPARISKACMYGWVTFQKSRLPASRSLLTIIR